MLSIYLKLIISPPNNPPCTGTTIPTNPQPGFTDENGCPIGAPSLPNFPVRNNPCEKLKNLLDPAKANLKPLIIHGMYDHINNNPSGEGGINLKREANGNLSSEPSAYTNTNKANILTGGYYYAGVHSHPKDTYPMFSWTDIYVLYKLEMNIASFNYRQSSLLLVCEDANGVKQTYAIIFENVGSMMEAILNNPKYAGYTPKEICDEIDLVLQEKYDEEKKRQIQIMNVYFYNSILVLILACIKQMQI
ncbi:hypothetical protein [Chryseobacterium luquanense]|uniref:Uncharacterized protein n=1 Tax=Chryseobacterium luquanense TaxID=2983766 RepID=A0ABT3Y9M3_9FLAO|nr:hypothetical protein [Chryseobacterium luquanense]MCX8534696.1 hypothetical protein [Chryseobacterium luquanense]